MKHTSLILVLLVGAFLAPAQTLKPRPDAFPSLPDSLEPKALLMASTLEEMTASWDRYPTYPLYLEMMQHYADRYPAFCRVDTIGTSLQGRLILALAITGAEPGADPTGRPEVFLTSTMHGDEIAGYYLMLRLADTLIRSYGVDPYITRLLDRTVVYINPLSNPDGTYHGGDTTVASAWRYNANYVDLNRNYPDPFGTDPVDPVQQENLAMIDYVASHHFRLSANIHGGSEVFNYPWDSFESSERPHPLTEWWKQGSKRYVDTCRLRNNRLFTDVVRSGYLQGGDWYVIPNGRQDYFNYCYGIREITMELSTVKKLSSAKLPLYWQYQGSALVRFIDEVLPFADSTDDTAHLAIRPVGQQPFVVYPNPTRGPISVVTPQGILRYDLSDRPAGLHIIRVQDRPVKVIKL